MTLAFILLAAVAQGQATTNCVSFASPRITTNQTVVLPLQAGLEFRMVSIGANGLRIQVGPSGDSRKDYLWALSPPYRTAPHRQVGPGYGLDARQSATFTPREFKYVVTDADFQKANALADRAESGDVDLAGLEALGRGILRFRITGFAVDPVAAVPLEGGILEWVAISGEGCVPK